MDPTKRRLLRVQIEDGIAADEIFQNSWATTPTRRAFIGNALIARSISSGAAVDRSGQGRACPDQTMFRCSMPALMSRFCDLCCAA